MELKEEKHLFHLDSSYSFDYGCYTEEISRSILKHDFRYAIRDLLDYLSDLQYIYLLHYPNSILNLHFLFATS